jgi:hypothetical protein
LNWTGSCWRKISAAAVNSTEYARPGFSRVPRINLPLANFTASMTTEIRRDDSVDGTREFEIEARLGGQTRWSVIAAERRRS